MDLIQLRYFKTLAELQHMTRAANALHVAQPALSRSLRRLEQELGLPLFDRIGKNIVINENGKLLLNHTRTILGELEEAQREMSDRKKSAKSQVGISMHAGTKLLPGLIREFQREHPDITVRITQQGGESGQIPENCDILIYSSIEPADKPDSVTLMREEICLAMPVTNPLSKQSSVMLADVAREPFICLYKGRGLRTVTDEYCKMAGFTPRIVLESDSPGTVRELIALGMGLAFIPRVTWDGTGNDPNVTLVEIETPHCIRYVNMEWRNHRYETAAVRAMRDFLIRFFQKAEEDFKQNQTR